MAVRYFTDDCTYRLPQKRLTARWLHEVAAGEGYALGDVTYIFCSAQRLLAMNRQYLGHDYFTDVITFDYSDRKGARIVSGDIFIDVETVADNPPVRRDDLAGDAQGSGPRGAAPLRAGRQNAPHQCTDAPKGGQIPEILGGPSAVTSMKHARFIAATVLAALLLAGCTGRRTAGDAADKASAGDGTSETAVSTPEPTGEETPAGERSPLAASRTWTGSDGSSKRWGPFAENDTTFLFVHEYLIGSDTNRYKVFIRKGPQPNDIPNFASLSPQNESAWKDFTDLLHTLKKRRPGPLAHHAALAGLPHSWTPVRSFRESYYVNCFNPYPVWISDSLFVRQTMDGPRPSRISAAERIAPTHYRLRTTAGDAGIDRVDIYLVDTVCRMAVFAFSNDRKTERFQSLYVPFETGLEMDMIDFHSLELPDESEVEWDETDFEALISGAVPLRETDPKTDKTNNE